MAKRNEKQKDKNQPKENPDSKNETVEHKIIPPDEKKKKSLSEKIDYIESTNTYRIIKLIIPFLAILGLGYAIWDNYDSNRQAEKIVKQISTQYVGNFPNQIDNFADKIEEAERRIIIAVDHPAYGVFSNPIHFKDYYEKIRSKFNPRTNGNFQKLTLICYSHEKRKYEFLKQFGISESKFNDPEIFKEYYKNDSLKFKLFFSENNGRICKSWKEIFEVIEERNENIISSLTTLGKSGNKFEVVYIEKEDEPLPVYFWMFDDDSFAFLSFRSFGKLTKEVTISTSHPPIIQYLKGIHNDVFLTKEWKNKK